MKIEIKFTVVRVGFFFNEVKSIQKWDIFRLFSVDNIPCKH